MDAVFKAPKLPTAGSSLLASPAKRKASDDIAGYKGKQRLVQQQTAVTVAEDDDDDDNEDMDNSYEASFAPGNDSDYFVEEDADGRFFGGGLSSTQKQILEILDEGDDGQDTRNDPSALSLQSVRRQLLNLERAINKNAEMRIKWAGQPEKYVDSEVALDTAIQELLLLTSNPTAFYPELTKLGIVSSLADLLSHENIDISLSVVNVLEELTDDDVAEAGEGGDEDEDEDVDGGARDAVAKLADDLVKAQLVELAVANISRLREAEEEAERAGVFHTLGLVENLLSLLPTLSTTITSQTTLLAWLLKRLQPPSMDKQKGKAAAQVKDKQKAEDPAMAQNRQYAAELLAILLQGDAGADARNAFTKEGGVQVALQVLSTFRKRDPLGAEELEYMENIFDALCSALSSSETKAIFVQEEGTELMVIMMREKLLARTRAIKVLDHAMSGEAGAQACETFVDAQGLKGLFSALMQTEAKAGKKWGILSSTDEEHVLGILASLFANLPSESVSRIRVLRKFVEEDYAKVTRLVAIRTALLGRVRKREAELKRDREMLEKEGLDLDDVEEYLRRLDAGLYSLQLADYILAWICMEDDGVRDHARDLLAKAGSSFKEVVDVLEEYQRNIGDSTGIDSKTLQTNGDADGTSGAFNEGAKLRDIVGHLLEYIRGC